MSKRHRKHHSVKRRHDTCESEETKGAINPRDAICMSITFGLIGCVVIVIEHVLHSESNTIYHVAAGVLASPLHFVVRRFL